jgi:hypothetical protein
MSSFCCSCRFLLYHAALSVIDAMFGEYAITQLYRPNVNLSAGKINPYPANVENRVSS